jgi:hypothetical protein
VIDEHPAHHARRQCQEVRAALPVDIPLTEQPQVRFVDERRRLKSVVPPFSAKMGGGAAPEILVHQRQERVLGVGIPP